MKKQIIYAHNPKALLQSLHGDNIIIEDLNLSPYIKARFSTEKEDEYDKIDIIVELLKNNKNIITITIDTKYLKTKNGDNIWGEYTKLTSMKNNQPDEFKRHYILYILVNQQKILFIKAEDLLIAMNKEISIDSNSQKPAQTEDEELVWINPEKLSSYNLKNNNIFKSINHSLKNICEWYFKIDKIHGKYIQNHLIDALKAFKGK